MFRNKKNIKRSILHVCIMAVMASMVLVVAPKKSMAVCCDCCWCISETVGTDFSEWATQDWIQITFHMYMGIQLLHQPLFMKFNFWEQELLPTITAMGTQLSGVAMQQVMMIGMFLDAKEQLETQRMLQVMQAEAHKNYHPSVGMCEFGTRIKSLAASERKGEANALIMSKRSTERFLGNTKTASAPGRTSDAKIRLDRFQERFCNTYDNNNALQYVCPNIQMGTNKTGAVKNRFNKDVDYQRTIQNPWTIDLNLSDEPDALGEDVEVFAMANHLYGYDSFGRINADDIKNPEEGELLRIQQAFVDMHAAVAKTKVAENSFNALMALKGSGTGGSAQYLEAYLEQLGIDPGEVEEFLGTNPSYHAQMEILTKKAYQTPQFYTNLYDKPANIKRKGVAMQAIGLIQKFDLLKSYLRTEASLSVLLELSVEQLQREVEDKIRALDNN